MGMSCEAGIHQASYIKSIEGRSEGRPFSYEKSGVCADDRAVPFWYATIARKGFFQVPDELR
jgi:hypothetical protein